MLNQDEEKGHCQKVGDTSGEIIQHRCEVPEKEKTFIEQVNYVTTYQFVSNMQ